jgi:hypothetical protein
LNGVAGLVENPAVILHADVGSVEGRAAKQHENGDLLLFVDVPLIVVGFQPTQEVLAHLGRLAVVLIVAVRPNGDGVILVEDQGLHGTNEIADDVGNGCW